MDVFKLMVVKVMELLLSGYNNEHLVKFSEQWCLWQRKKQLMLSLSLGGQSLNLALGLLSNDYFNYSHYNNFSITRWLQMPCFVWIQNQKILSLLSSLTEKCIKSSHLRSKNHQENVFSYKLLKVIIQSTNWLLINSLSVDQLIDESLSLAQFRPAQKKAAEKPFTFKISLK